MKSLSPYIIIVILSVVCVFAVKGCWDNSKKSSHMEDALWIYRDSAKLYSDKYKTAHAQNTLMAGQREEIRLFYSSQIDSMADLLKIKPKQIKSIVYVPFEAHINLDSLKEVLKSVDTQYVKIPIKDENSVDINGIMSLTKYEDRYGFLNLKRKQLLDVHFNNPVFSPLNVSGFDISQKTSHIKGGIQAGYGFTLHGLSPYLGAGITYTF